MVAPTSDVTARAGFTLHGSPGTSENFPNIFLPNVGEDQKKSYHLSAGSLALSHIVNPALVVALRS